MSRRHTFAASGAASEGRAASQPITAHRLFPALVALWFAALLGLGSFVVPASLIERASGATGLAALVPAAAPPLGLTARMLIAGVMTLVGVVVGLGLAVRLRPRPVEVVRRRGAVPRSFDAVEDAAPAQPVAAPLATGDDDTLRVRAFDAHPDAPPRKPFVLSDDLVLGEDAPPVEPEAHDIPASTLAHEAFEDAEWSEVEDDDQAFADVADAELEAPEIEVRAKRDTATPPQAAHTAARGGAARGGAARGGAAITGAPLESLGLVQLVERLALAIDARRTLTGGDGQPAAAPVAPVAPVAFAVPEVEPVAAAVVQPVEPEPAEEEAPRQIFVVPAVAEAVAATADSVAPVVVDLAPETAEPLVEPVLPVRPATPLPRLFGASEAPAQPPRILTARWDTPDEDEAHDDEIVVPRFLGGGQTAMPVASEPRDAAPRQEFIRDHAVEADPSEPVVVFPGHGTRVPTGLVAVAPVEPQGAEDTERALKAALATLQRMTARG